MAAVARKLTADEFFAKYAAVDGKHELVNGVVYNMTGALARHNLIAGNINVALSLALRGSGCRSIESMGVAPSTDDVDVLYPDVGVFRDRRDLSVARTERLFRYPLLIVEVFSPTTRRLDLGRKLELYRSIEALRGILYVDPQTEALFWHVRTSEGWQSDFLPPPDEIDWAGFAFTLTRADIFG